MVEKLVLPTSYEKSYYGLRTFVQKYPSLGPGTANWVFSFVNVHETTRTTDSQLTQDLWESSVTNLGSLASLLS